jgi:hypothetical protein
MNSFKQKHVDSLLVDLHGQELKKIQRKVRYINLRYNNIRMLRMNFIIMILMR